MNGVDYGIHAAAIKQVPACEYNTLKLLKPMLMLLFHPKTQVLRK